VSDVFAELVRLQKERRAVCLCTVVRTAGSTPRKSAARMLVVAGGGLVGTVGGGRLEQQVIEAARALLERADGRAQLLRYHLTRELGMCCGGEMEVFVEPLLPDPPLVVCGGGHVALALVPLAARVGFAPILVEDLEELGGAGRFPDATLLVDSFDVRDWRGVPLDEGTYAVIVTRDHGQDQALLEQLLPYDLAYLGLIGSRRKIAMFHKRLENKGFDPARLARVHAPVGLDIGAETPEEIAVAIVAELIQVRAARRPPRPAPSAAPVPAPGDGEG
jgi:xanthine dehydrogenase accessory factor